MRKSIGAADVLRIFEEWLRIETANLPTDSAIVCSRIECIDRMNAAHPVLEIGPERLHVVAERRDDAQTSYNYSAIGHGNESLKREALNVKTSARSHSNALNCLKEFSFGLDRRRDDNLRLLKFGDISSANVAHAGRNRTN